MEENDQSKKFLDQLKDKVRAIKFTRNNGGENMRTLNELKDGEIIPRGGIILRKQDTIGSIYYSESDIMKAIADFSQKISKSTQTSEVIEYKKKNERHIVTRSQKVDMEDFAKMIAEATKVYLMSNDKITTQDARIVSRDVETDLRKEVKNTGGLFAGKKGTELENEPYINEDEIRVAVKEYIETMIIPIPIPMPIAPITPIKPSTPERTSKDPTKPVVPVTPTVEGDKTIDNDKEKEEEPEKHKVTKNKGKVKNLFKKAALISLITIVLLANLKGCQAQVQGDGKDVDTQVDYVKVIDESADEIVKDEKMEINSDFLGGVGTEFSVKEGTDYLKDPRIEKDDEGQKTYKVSPENPYVKPGDKVYINGISINDEEGKTVAFTYDPGRENSVTVEEFIKSKTPDNDATYKIFIHIATDETDLGWVRAGSADIKVEKVEKAKGYYIVSTKEGEIIEIIGPDGAPANIDEISPIEQAPENIQKEAEEQINARNDNKTEDQVEIN